MQQTKNLQ